MMLSADDIRNTSSLLKISESAKNYLSLLETLQVLYIQNFVCIYLYIYIYRGKCVWFTQTDDCIKNYNDKTDLHV